MSTENFYDSSPPAAPGTKRPKRSNAWSSRGRHMLAALQRVGQAVAGNVFPAACASCRSPLMAFRATGLCDPCFEVLEPNLGRRCAVCDSPIATGRRCKRCRNQSPAFDRIHAPWIYGGPVADLVWAAKFRHAEHLARSLGAVLLAAPHADWTWARSAQALIAVPLSGRRGRERGYNQATYIARVLAAAWGLPVWHALRRDRDTAVQSELPAHARATNTRGAFAATRALGAARVVLVDDVVTSGETVAAAAAALRNAGALSVTVVAVARAELRHPPAATRRRGAGRTATALR